MSASEGTVEFLLEKNNCERLEITKKQENYNFKNESFRIFF